MFYTVKYCSALEWALSTTLEWLCVGYTPQVYHMLLRCLVIMKAQSYKGPCCKTGNSQGNWPFGCLSLSCLSVTLKIDCERRCVCFSYACCHASEIVSNLRWFTWRVKHANVPDWEHEVMVSSPQSWLVIMLRHFAIIFWGTRLKHVWKFYSVFFNSSSVKSQPSLWQITASFAATAGLCSV